MSKLTVPREFLVRESFSEGDQPAALVASSGTAESTVHLATPEPCLCWGNPADGGAQSPSATLAVLADDDWEAFQQRLRAAAGDGAGGRLSPAELMLICSTAAYSVQWATAAAWHMYMAVHHLACAFNPFSPQALPVHASITRLPCMRFDRLAPEAGRQTAGAAVRHHSPPAPGTVCGA